MISCRALGSVEVHLRLIPLRLLASSASVQERQLRQALVAIGDDSRSSVMKWPAIRSIVESSNRSVLYCSAQIKFAVHLAHQHHQVVGCTALADVNGRHVEQRALSRLVRAVVEAAELLPGEGDLEQRCVARVTNRP